MEMKSMTYGWHFDPALLILVLAANYGYYLVSGFRATKNSWCFWLAIAVLLLSEFLPLRIVTNGAFSAHMIRHVLLLLLCGPLLIMSIPSKPVVRSLKALLSISAFFRRYPWVAWVTGVGIMWLWHIPAIFNSPGHSMLLRSGSLLIAGMVFSWPLFGPVADDHIHPMTGIVYLFTACVSCSLLGLLITFAPLHTFGDYALADQQAAGLIMWVPCCFVYLAGCIILLIFWFAEKVENVADQLSNLNHSLTKRGKRK